jgi:hypothetical protein
MYSIKQRYTNDTSLCISGLGKYLSVRFALRIVSMVLRKAADQQSSLEARFERRRFTRRADLTNNIRLTIAANALHAMMNGVWEAITSLADEYDISRPLVCRLYIDWPIR